MRFECKVCKTPFDIPDARLTPGKTLKVTCSNCREVMFVRGGAAPPPVTHGDLDAATVALEDEGVLARVIAAKAGRAAAPPPPPAPEQDPHVWFVTLPNAQQMGPLSLAELQEAARHHDIGPATLIWKEGMDGWKAAAVLEQTRAFVALPPAPPPSGAGAAGAAKGSGFVEFGAEDFGPEPSDEEPAETPEKEPMRAPPLRPAAPVPAAPKPAARPAPPPPALAKPPPPPRAAPKPIIPTPPPAAAAPVDFADDDVPADATAFEASPFMEEVQERMKPEDLASLLFSTGSGEGMTGAVPIEVVEARLAAAAEAAKKKKTPAAPAIKMAQKAPEPAPAAPQPAQRPAWFMPVMAAGITLIALGVVLVVLILVKK
jgi:predicted Zn finger-like uncharacterized protein